MNFEDKLNAIKFIRPNAKFVLRDDQVEWLDEEQIEPTKIEIEDGLSAYKAHLAELAKAEITKKKNLSAKLQELGLTVEDLQILGI